MRCQNGASASVQKPFSPAALRSAVDAALAALFIGAVGVVFRSNRILAASGAGHRLRVASACHCSLSGHFRGGHLVWLASGRLERIGNGRIRLQISNYRTFSFLRSCQASIRFAQSAALA